MGSFSKLIYHIIFVTRYRRKTKLNLFANTFRIKRSTIESNRLKRSISSFYNATGLNSSDDICSRARTADCCRRFAAWRDWVGYPIPWTHTHGYMLPPLRGLRRSVTSQGWFCNAKRKPRMDAKETNVKFASIGACSRLKLVADADEKHEAFARSVLCRFVLPTNY